MNTDNQPGNQTDSKTDSKTERKAAARVTELIVPIVSDLKLDLYDLEYNGGMLRVTIDTPAGSPGGVTLDQIALVTRLISRDLDHHDPIAGRYTLEVSSPGLERTMRTPAHFKREVGKQVQVRLRAVESGMRRFQGELISADDVAATFRLDDAQQTEKVVSYDQIDRAKTIFQWGPVSKPGKGPAKKAIVKGSRGAASVKLAPGPSDELDEPIEHQEATA